MNSTADGSGTPAPGRRNSRGIVRWWPVFCFAVIAGLGIAYIGLRDKPSAPSGRLDAERPNVLIVMIDTLRADHLGCYGHGRNTSPNIDRIAVGGARFERAYSAAPWTPPSIASLFSSLYPASHHVLQYGGLYATRGAALQGDQLPQEIETLAELFSRGGYQTAAFVCNPWVTVREGFDQGFDRFDDSLARLEELPPAAAINAAALEFLNTKRDPSRPWLMYLHYMDVHAPYNAPDRFREPFVEEVRRTARTTGISAEERSRLGGLRNIEPTTVRKDPQWVDQPAYWSALYDAGIAHLDDQFGAFYEQLRERGELKNTIVVVLADHGEELYDHGGWDHGFSLYDHQLHVPLIVSWPGHTAPGGTVSSIVGLVDVFPTLCELCKLPGPVLSQGSSFAALVLGGPSEDQRIAFAEGVKKDECLKAVYFEGSKLVLHQKEFYALLFDLDSDPGEQSPLQPSETTRAVFQALKAKAEGVMTKSTELGMNIPAASTPLPDDVRERLRSLGYLD